MTNKVGRPKKQYPIQEIQNIIYRFAKEKKVTGKIQYMEVYRFANELFEKGETSQKVSEFYWRKGTGRQLIDEINTAMFNEVVDSNEDEIIIDTTSTVNKYFNGKKSDREKLIGTLSVNERKLKKYLKEFSRQKKKILELERLIQNQKETVDSLENKVSFYEDQFFQWLELSINKNIPLYNLGTTGKSRTSITENLLKNLFSDNPFTIFEEMQKNKFNSNIKQEDTTVQISNVKDNLRSVLDDIDFDV